MKQQQDLIAALRSYSHHTITPTQASQQVQGLSISDCKRACNILNGLYRIDSKAKRMPDQMLIQHQEKPYDEGKRLLSLTDEQMQAENFGWHTVNAIKRMALPDTPNKITRFDPDKDSHLKSYTESKSQRISEAYQKVQGLTSDQIDGLDKGLARSDVEGLTSNQINGLCLGLTGAQVKIEHFTSSTIEAIKKLTSNPVSKLPLMDAYEKVKGLQYYQMHAMFHYGLGREEAEKLSCDLSQEMTVVSVVDALKKTRPTLPLTTHLYQQADKLTDAQYKGIVQYDLTMEDVQSENFGIHTLNLIDLIKTCKGENISKYDAYQQIKDVPASQQDREIIPLILRNTPSLPLTDAASTHKGSNRQDKKDGCCSIS